MCSVIRLLTHSVADTNVTICFWHLLLRLRGFVIGSLSFSSLYSHLQEFLSLFFLIAHYSEVSHQRSIRWFNDYSWKSSLRDLLSSVLKHQLSHDSCSSHTRFAAWRSGDFYHPPRRIDAENQTLINRKCVCGALNRHFCQTRVISCFFNRKHIYFKTLGYIVSI